MKYKIVLWQSEEGFSVSCPGCLAVGYKGKPSKKPSKALKTPFGNIGKPSQKCFKMPIRHLDLIGRWRRRSAATPTERLNVFILKKGGDIHAQLNSTRPVGQRTPPSINWIQRDDMLRFDSKVSVKIREASLLGQPCLRHWREKCCE
jgi:hypothetical protein